MHNRATGQDGWIQPRSQGLSSSFPLERERETLGTRVYREREEERPWQRGWVGVPGSMMDMIIKDKMS